MPVHIIPTSEVPPMPTRRRVCKSRVIDFLAEELKREEKKAARQAKHARMAKLVVSLKAKAAGAGR